MSTKAKLAWTWIAIVIAGFCTWGLIDGGWAFVSGMAIFVLICSIGGAIVTLLEEYW